ncbi:tetratricopeptide repeat-containing diguanylate cyclase [Couchioplanes azureus]|uniref:tetratricopeptide repeat-containing diguanylate cyclase n=1 Tax=Couchioplanes caeruleus TaxID=56438 RepID=UPI0019A74497|nr:GGDEF domain-containing protein [Couchioplanes caeruleus]GGQ59028.1 hypothetical protein GCM10010166_30560 [Couchioplanes caeruleus subsp. azureus]
MGTNGALETRFAECARDRQPERLAAALEALEMESVAAPRSLAELAGRAERLASELDRIELVMRARLIRGEACRQEGDLTTSGRIAHDVSAWATRHRHPYVLARSHLAVSRFRRHIGDQSDALAHAVQCLAHTGDDVPAGIRARHMSHLAVTLCESGSVDEASRRYREAFAIASAIGDFALSLRLLNNVAYTAYKNNDGEQAQNLIEEIRAFSARHDVPLDASYLDTIARIEIMRGWYARARATLHPLLHGTAEVPVDSHTLAESLLTLALAQRLDGDVAAAQATLRRAVAMCEEQDLASVRARARDEQAQLYAVTGRYREAYEEYRLFHGETQALQSAQREARARTLQAVFETQEARRESSRFREMALRDPLTGLYNRRFVDEHLTMLCERAAEQGTPLSVALVDLDYFKRINDTLSHAAGDTVLQQVAVLLTGTAAEPAVAARLGGEEFVVLLPDTGTDDAVLRCERLRLAIAGHPWQPVTGELPVTASIGVTTIDAGKTTPSALLARADHNLYTAKRTGRNRVAADPAGHASLAAARAT